MHYKFTYITSGVGFFTFGLASAEAANSNGTAQGAQNPVLQWYVQ